MTADDRPGSGVVWARVEEGFHVASARGAFLGYIDREADGSYLAYNGRSRPVGRFPALVAAMAAVAHAHDDVTGVDSEIELRQIPDVSSGPVVR
ncbi:MULTISPECIES: hypothetical protein [Microbacterium]|jgi:hypothetical protein|uniref:Uncharacterized protein n=1 Tax=Microbacterium mcarthurae TaxID=3035918 RepID=A0ABW9GFE6_9MICO|nr:hypothetical protein [Microbacterium sp. ACRRU]MCG7416774.1 hypothetical protein [Microbacterium sp. ACRRU]